ncbi:hypothetical protein HCG51_14795 [Tolypothrix sp. PCC 7910]|uniref:hypothetical protein n=1 Tax=Tolypothrix sp. PCC 7910 TaxID=2099387 RepID=UPI0014277A0C|nr:hypothetical protein [Tolypothrix sp. PCC 7910]QIR37854.1 hypothetical protein HCG51_14795 [Tolypothrix sp. PCC 7910]
MDAKHIKKKTGKAKSKTFEPKPRNSQHIKILSCNQLINQVIYECWHCKQGLLSEMESYPPRKIEVSCPNCAKTAIRLMAQKLLSTTEIPSPWQS